MTTNMAGGNEAGRSCPVVLLVCQFGEPVRGLSPYGDALLNALKGGTSLTVRPVDYRAPYPGMFHPAARGAASGPGELHWGNPISWRRIALLPADIIHIQHWSAPMASYLAPLADMARRAGKRVVVTVHNPDAHESLRVAAPFERWLFGLADVLVVHDSRGAARLCERFNVGDERIRVVPHGIQVREAPALQETGDHARLGLKPARRYICMFGNLRGYKGIDILLGAWARVAAELPDVDLVIAGRLWSGQTGLGARLAARLLGTGRDAARIRAALAAPEVAGRMHLREGFQADADIDALLRMSDLAVFPYVRFASQSGAACRAAGMGCPVLVSDVGGLPELAIDRNWVVAPGDAEGLAATLQDKLLRADIRSFRSAQLEQVRAHDWSRVAAAHAALYRDLT